MPSNPDGQLIGVILEKWPIGSGACAYVVGVGCSVKVKDRVRIVKPDGTVILDAISGLEDRGKMVDAVESGQPGLLMSSLEGAAGDLVYLESNGAKGAADSAASALSAEVMAEVARLGGKLTPRATGGDGSATAPRRIDGHDLPDTMATFVRDIDWPNQTYGSGNDGDLEVWSVEFGSVGWLDPNEIPIADRGDRELIYFALTDGGNYFLVMDVADPNPADPRVYVIDHDDAEQELGSGTRLSELLRQLQPEG